MVTTPHSQSTQSAPEQAGPQQTPRTGIALTLIAATQLMLVLDGTIMNIALPSVQTALDIPAGRLSWVVNTYALTFGGLLLLGGRIGDLWGRRRVFRFSLALFAAASLAGGLATQETVLIAARACQGVAAAIAAPTALSLIATTFAEGPSRNRAMGVYGAMSGLGSIIGLLLGGLLTEFLNWRWVLFVNIPICLAVLAGTGVLVEGSRVRGRLDLPGALTGSLGLLVLVYAIVRGGDAGWSDPVTLGAGLAALLLLSCFLVIQSRSPHPMMPLGLLRDRNRGAAYATMLLVGGGMFATYYFLTLFMQQVQGWDAMTTGLAYLPFATGMGVASGILGPRLLGRFSPRTVIVPGLAAATLGMVVFSQISPGSSYLLHLMPAMVLTSVGLGLSVVPLTLGALSGVEPGQSGIASGILNAGMQVGGALGLAVLSTVALTGTHSLLPDATALLQQGRQQGEIALVVQASEALTHGFGWAFLVGAGLYALALLLVASLMTTPGPAARPDRKA